MLVKCLPRFLWLNCLLTENENIITTSPSSLYRDYHLISSMREGGSIVARDDLPMNQLTHLCSGVISNEAKMK